MKKHILYIFTMLCIALLVGCGDSSDPAEAVKEDYNGFNSETNLTAEYGGYSFEIPEYYKEEEDGYTISGGIVYVTEYDSVKDAYDIRESMFKILEEEDGMSDFETDGDKFNASFQDSPVSGEVAYLANENLNKSVSLIFMQEDEAEYDYLPDFERVLSSATKLEKSEEISEDFKKTMDDYEEFFDHYIDVMKKYKENPTDTTLMSEATELMSEEVTMFDKLQNMDQSKMSTSELAYYLEVTARIQKKLADVVQ